MEIFLKVYVIISYTHKHIYVYVCIRCFKMPLTSFNTSHGHIDVVTDFFSFLLPLCSVDVG